MADSQPPPEELQSWLREALAELDRQLRSGGDGAAELLAAHPALARDRASALELAFAEFDLRVRLGQHVDPEEWCAGFPDLRDDLLRRCLAERDVRTHTCNAPGSREYASAPPATDTAMWHEDIGHVGGYELLKMIGRGGMGVVYEARQPGLNRVVALKMIRGGPHASPDAVVRFRREVEAVARLQHPNILQVYDVGDADGHPYLAMELVTGGGLDEALRKAPLPARDAARLIEVLAHAVDYAHRRGVIHRDLKPANVLLQPGPSSEPAVPPAERPPSGDTAVDLMAFTPKIADFGLAKLLTEDEGPTLTGMVLGTPSYMAPEQASGGGRHAGPPADVYALGAILYECLTGRPPFRGESALDTIALIGTCEPVPPSSLNPRVPRDLETVCLKCLEKSPARRYGTALALAEDLGRFIRDEPVRACPPTMADQLLKFARRHWGALAGAAAVFLAVVLGLIGTGIGLVQARNERDHARQAEREARERLAESYAQAAQLALQRGAWRGALANLDLALAAHHPEPSRLRLQKVRAWCGIHEITTAEAELEDLARQPDLGGQAGPLLLARADIALARSDDDPAALALVRQALDRGLPLPEQEYARGLLAETTTDAIEHFRRALDADPFHQRANGMLGLTLLTLGRLSEARERLRFARLFFPEDPTFAVMLAMTHALEGDEAAARVEIDRARGPLGERQVLAVQRTVELAQQIRGLEGVLNDDPSRLPAAIVTRLLPSITGVMAEVQSLKRADDRADPGLLLPIPPVLTRGVRQPLAALPLAWLGGSTRAIESLDLAFRNHPDALLAFTRGHVALGAQRLPEAEQAYLDAAGASSAIPLRRVSLFFAVFCEWERADKEPAARSEMLARAVRNARRLVEAGSPSPWQSAALVTMAVEADDLDLARRVLGEWERQAPQDLMLLRKRVAVELKSQAYGPAIAAADKYLERSPGDAVVARARSEAIEKLRRQANSYSR